VVPAPKKKKKSRLLKTKVLRGPVTYGTANSLWGGEERKDVLIQMLAGKNSLDSGVLNLKFSGTSY
jgi:hypothetical protein